MKLKPEHVATLRAAIAPLDTAERRAAYRAANATDTRYRWDLLWTARRNDTAVVGVTICEIYRYANDAHIDTALRSIVGKVRS